MLFHQQPNATVIEEDDQQQSEQHEVEGSGYLNVTGESFLPATMPVSTSRSRFDAGLHLPISRENNGVIEIPGALEKGCYTFKPAISFLRPEL